MAAVEYPEEPFRRLVSTFTASDRPEVVLFSGGEPLLRPALVAELAHTARTVGARTYLLTGMFFARSRRIPAPIQRALDAVDHVAASMDSFHEEEVPRSATFDVLHRLLDAGKHVSLQIVGRDDDDPYLAEVTDAVRREFSDRIPILVGHLAGVGRALDWWTGEQPSAREQPAADPCVLAAWPVVRFDGTVIACGNQDVVDATAPPGHLVLGRADVDDWATIRERTFASPLLRGIRLHGPLTLAKRYGTAVDCTGGYCSTCRRLGGDAKVALAVRALADRPTTAVLEAAVLRLQTDAGAEGFVRRHGSPRYAGLSVLGHDPRGAG